MQHMMLSSRDLLWDSFYQFIFAAVEAVDLNNG